MPESVLPRALAARRRLVSMDKLAAPAARRPYDVATLADRSMLVAVMDIGEVTMAVRHRQVPVVMTVRLVASPAGVMWVLVMLVVTMAVGVLQVVVSMLMAVLLGEVQPDADAHQ